MSDLQPKFDRTILCQADKTGLFVSRVFGMSDYFASSLESLTIPPADDFQDLLHYNQKGNLLGTTKCGSHVQTMMLNHPHKPSRHVTEDERLKKVKTELTAVKEKILTNIIQNVKDQCDTETYYFTWSGLDLQLHLSVSDKITHLKYILTLYCTTKVHIVPKYTNQKEEDTVAHTWECYEVKLEYPPKIDVSEEELSQEFEKSFQTVNRIYLTEVNNTKFAKTEVNQLNVWRTFHQNHYMEFSVVGQLIQTLIATAGNTSTLERGYTHLQMITSKRRNRMDPKKLKTLLLFAALKIHCKKPHV